MMYLGDVIPESVNGLSTEGGETYVTITAGGTEQHSLKTDLTVSMIIFYNQS
jgi:hypothetical protein